ncbi:MAG: hypothetical protein ACXABY_01195 [Candidatus Thorarchaeota archaeon]
MSTDGEEIGSVYGLDYGWIILTENDTLYVCGCAEGSSCDLPVPTPPPGPTPPTPPPPDPTPTPPTPPPTEEPKEKCNRGIGNDSEGCDPGNSSEQGRGEGRRAGEDRDE